MDYSYEQISRMIDHSLLKPSLTFVDFEAGCRMAAVYQAGSVCIQPHYLKRCAEILKGSGVKASTVIGFPHGGHCTSTKVAEAKQALADGGEELDLVCNISRVLSGDWDYVKADLKAVIEVTHAAGQKVKVIFENCYLNDDQKIRLCEICTELKADWVKTSTGYGTGGATMDDLRLMRKHSGPAVQVKAAGGVEGVATSSLTRNFAPNSLTTSINECPRKMQVIHMTNSILPTSVITSINRPSFTSMIT